MKHNLLHKYAFLIMALKESNSEFIIESVEYNDADDEINLTFSADKLTPNTQFFDYTIAAYKPIELVYENTADNIHYFSCIIN